jgi:hypothetical protein
VANRRSAIVVESSGVTSPRGNSLCVVANCRLRRRIGGRNLGSSGVLQRGQLSGQGPPIDWTSFRLAAIVADNVQRMVWRKADVEAVRGACYVMLASGSGLERGNAGPAA